MYKTEYEKWLNSPAVEVAKTVTGESLFTADVLSMSINAVKEEKVKTDVKIYDIMKSVFCIWGSWLYIFMWV